MLTDKQHLGNRGEQLAEQFLIKKNYSIRERNFRFKRSEIDLIVEDGDFLVFVEVKTRSRLDYGFPEDAVDERKAKKVVEAAEEYMHEINWQGPIRFDVVSITINGSKELIEHFPDAFY